MKLLVNNEALEVAGIRLGEVLDELGYRDAVIATAVNGNFVPCRAREALILREGDEVELLAPMQGG
jgi:sulfur carrier protein